MFAAAALPALASARAVRRDWRALSQEDKDTFGRGFNLLKTSGRFDEIVKLHQDCFETPTPWEGRSCEEFPAPEGQLADCPLREEADIVSCCVRVGGGMPTYALLLWYSPWRPYSLLLTPPA